ncbi:MAG: sensory box histidine kinase/response regulator [uncultured bacterium]|nr:MAG: sensory box histidine kinase/response regulator [uncultured bacterium]
MHKQPAPEHISAAGSDEAELTAQTTRIAQLEMAVARAEQQLTIETGRRRTSEAILLETRNKSEALELIVNNSHAIVFSWQARNGLTVTFVTDNVRRFGYTPQDFYTGKIRLNDIVHPDDLQVVTDKIARHSSNRGIMTFSQQYRIITAGGEVVWIDDRTRIIRDNTGKIVRYEGIFLDISEAKKTEEALRRSQEMLQSVIDNIPQLIFWKDRNSVYRGCNRPFAAAAGLDHPGQIVGKIDRELPWAPEETEWYLLCDRRVMDSDTPELHIAETQVRADGRKTWLDTCKIPLHDVDGKVCGITGTVEDITDRKEGEEELLRHRDHLEELVQKRTAELARAKEKAEEAVQAFRLQHDFLHTLIETIPNPLFYKNSEGRYTGCNAAFESYLGKPRSAIIGKTVFEMAPADIAARYHHNDQELLAKPGTQHYTWKVFRADGILRDVIFDKATIHDSGGKVVGLLGVITDITDLVEARKEAEIANAAKGEFLANMSHEIRTPLNGILGMAELLLTTPLTPDQHQYAQTVVSCGEALLTVINDILDFSKIEAGKLRFNIVDFDLRHTMDELYKIVNFHAARKGLLFLVTVDPRVPTLLKGDPARLSQVLLNLATNAVKFTESGKVSIAVTLKSETPTWATLHFEVSDTGIGIAPEQTYRLFQSFSQIDGSFSRKYGGTGLGLAICKKLVAIMGGTIDVKSRENHGSTFRFDAILAKQEKAAPATADMVQLPQLQGDGTTARAIRILLVEDNFINQTVAMQILKNLGCRVVAADNGRQALDAIKEQSFDLIFMDVQMPEMDGLEATRAIRQWEARRNANHAGRIDDPADHSRDRRIPIIALTAHAMVGDRQKCLDAGMDDYLAKPVVPAILAAKIKEWLGEGGGDD